MSQQSKQTLRSLLRRLKTPPLPKELLTKNATKQNLHNNHTRKLLLEHYRSYNKSDNGNAAAASSNSKASLLSLRYEELLTSLQERQRLYDLDKGAEELLTPKEMSRRAAARAGLQLPIEVDF